MKAVASFLVFTILLFCGCRKLIDIDRNYVGEWRGGSGDFSGMNYRLTISEDGGAEYERTYESSENYGHEHWFGPLKSNGKRFQIAYASPWFIIIEDPVLTNENVS